MKISELAAYREVLEDLKPKDSPAAINRELDAVLYVVANRAIAMPKALADLTHARDESLAGVTKFDASLQRLLDDLLEQIKNLEPVYLARSYQLYDEGRKFDSVEYMLNRKFTVTADLETYIQSRVQAHSDYHHAGMIIRPGLERWIEHMVACDPLYVVDTDHAMFEPTKKLFTSQYQSRLRYYAIRESDQDAMLTDLPDNQLGFVLAYNFFHYKPFEIMRAYLREIYSKLRPGGVLAMTFTDCDRRGGAELAERMMNCYTPGRLVIGACESAGFLIEQNYRMDAAINWVEMRKPGQIESLRGGQTLAKIIAKSK